MKGNERKKGTIMGLMLLLLGASLLLSACEPAEEDSEQMALENGTDLGSGEKRKESSSQGEGSAEQTGADDDQEATHSTDDAETAAEQTGAYTIDQTYDSMVNGMKLTLRYDSQSKAFVGTVENTLNRKLDAVYVEVYQFNGVELEPTPRIDLLPGEVMTVYIPSVGTFDAWTAYPKTETETGQGTGG